MTDIIDYYEILGVIPSAETAVIKAAYRALVSIYHPDKNPDITTSDKIVGINAAYSILSDQKKRKEYDEARESTQHNASKSAFEQTGTITTDQLEKDWEIAIGFFPEIKYEYEDLYKISWRLAFAFKLQLLEEQKYPSSNQLATKLKSEYLTRYFGKNNQLCTYAEKLIKAHEIEAALYLNKIINVMGCSVDFWRIKNQVDQKYPESQGRVRGYELYSKVVDYQYNDSAPIHSLIELHHGKIKRRFFKNTITLELNNQKYEFDDNLKFRTFILEYFAETYA